MSNALKQPASLSCDVHFKASPNAEKEAAKVVHVWSDDMVNLVVWDANGLARQVTSVPRATDDTQGMSWDFPVFVPAK